MDNLEQDIQWLQQLKEIVQSVTVTKLSDEHLKVTQIIILHVINNLQGNMTISKETKKFGIGPAVCSKNVGVFLHLGLIKGRENSQDRRHVDLSLTAKGKKVLRQAENQLADLINNTQAAVKKTL